MNVSLQKVDMSARAVLENLFQYYIYDMSEFTGWPPANSGLYTFNSTSLDRYWQLTDHVPYFIYADNELAGFVLIRPYPGKLDVLDVEQFFVLRKFKGQGVGKDALAAVLAIHPGQWQIRVLKENSAAFRFWHSAVGRIVGSNYFCTMDIDIDLEMHFIRFHTCDESIMPVAGR